MGNKDNALSSLKKAVEHGFKDAEKLENDFDLKSIRDEKQFKKILEEDQKEESVMQDPGYRIQGVK